MAANGTQQVLIANGGEFEHFLRTAHLRFETEDMQQEDYCANCRKWNICFTAEGKAAHNYSMYNWKGSDQAIVAWGYRVCKEKACKKVPDSVKQFEAWCSQDPNAAQVVQKLSAADASAGSAGTAAPNRWSRDSRGSATDAVTGGAPPGLGLPMTQWEQHLNERCQTLANEVHTLRVQNQLLQNELGRVPDLELGLRIAEERIKKLEEEHF